ncbi:MAG: hypothetical protein AAGI53_17930 [Planctomycetota bacterium]
MKRLCVRLPATVDRGVEEFADALAISKHDAIRRVLRLATEGKLLMICASGELRKLNTKTGLSPPVANLKGPNRDPSRTSSRTAAQA